MTVLHRRGEATVKEVLDELGDPVTDSAIRSALKLLERKGWVRHRADGPRNVYRPTASEDEARRSALRTLLDTFFQGSPEQAVQALLDPEDFELSEVELERIEAFIEEARKSGGRGC